VQTQAPLWQTVFAPVQLQLPPQPSSPQLVPSQLGVQATHWPLWQLSVEAQPDPQLPPQPSSPHWAPPQLGVQQLPLAQTAPGSHWQVLPQPSLTPQLLPQLGVQATHWPLSQVSLPMQVPQVPPQPSSPQVAVPQSGVQQVPPWQTALPSHWQVPPQPSSPPQEPLQVGAQSTQVPLAQL